MNVLCFDISSGGLSAAIIDRNLHAERFLEIPWQIWAGRDGAATLDAGIFKRTFGSIVKSMAGEGQFGAISFSCFMHSCVLLDEAAKPLTPISTWMDRRGTAGVDYLRREMGDAFYSRTGCRFHPMFPVFKIAELSRNADPLVAATRRIVSAKALLLHELTGVWTEDQGTASASGLFGLENDDWDRDILRLIGISRDRLSAVTAPDAIIGRVTAEAASRYGLAEGLPVAAGSGDGFLANLGSGCETPKRIAVTLGTSASVRQTLAQLVLDKDSGTFCYRASPRSFLLGCASNNGGNVLDWGRSVFGAAFNAAIAAIAANAGKPDAVHIPLFIPLLNGERSPDWNPTLTASWQDIRASHTAQDLARSVVEGVVFNLVHYLEIVQSVSRSRADQVIISGNGFLESAVAELLGLLTDAPVLMPERQGLASLRGAAICGLRALGINTANAVEALIGGSKVITSHDGVGLRSRYSRYRELRARSIGD